MPGIARSTISINGMKTAKTGFNGAETGRNMALQEKYQPKYLLKRRNT
jgi:hypothetical protein